MSLSRTSFGVDSSGQLRIRIAGPPVPVPEFYALLDAALRCEGWNPHEGVVEDTLPPDEAKSSAASLETLAGQGRWIARQVFRRGDEDAETM